MVKIKNSQFSAPVSLTLITLIYILMLPINSQPEETSQILSNLQPLLLQQQEQSRQQLQLQSQKQSNLDPNQKNLDQNLLYLSQKQPQPQTKSLRNIFHLLQNSTHKFISKFYSQTIFNQLYINQIYGINGYITLWITSENTQLNKDQFRVCTQLVNPRALSTIVQVSFLVREDILDGNINTWTKIKNNVTGNGNKKDDNKQQQQSCFIYSDNTWACLNTMINYTVFQLTQNKKSEQITANYFMRVQHTNPTLQQQQKQFNPKNIQIQLQIQKILPQIQINLSVQSYTKTVLSFGTYINEGQSQYVSFQNAIVFLCGLIVQILSAWVVRKQLENRTDMFERLACWSVSFCGVWDLLAMYTFLHKAMYMDSNEKLQYFYLFFGLLSGILYFVYDIRILTKILTSQHTTTTTNSISKKLITHYLLLTFLFAIILFLHTFPYQQIILILQTCFLLAPQILHNFCYLGLEKIQYNFVYLNGYLASRFVTMYEFYVFGVFDGRVELAGYVWMVLSVFVAVQILILILQSICRQKCLIPLNYLKYKFTKMPVVKFQTYNLKNTKTSNQKWSQIQQQNFEQV